MENLASGYWISITLFYFCFSFLRNEIVSLLSVNRRVGADLIADVVDQSADNLVDGVTAGKSLSFDVNICTNLVNFKIAQ